MKQKKNTSRKKTSKASTEKSLPLIFGYFRKKKRKEKIWTLFLYVQLK